MDKPRTSYIHCHGVHLFDTVALPHAARTHARTQAYFELKAPICCDIMVAFYWVIWPLSMMGMCTCMPLTFGCCLGRKAFHQNPDAEKSPDRDVMETSNPVDEDLG